MSLYPLLPGVKGYIIRATYNTIILYPLIYWLMCRLTLSALEIYNLTIANSDTPNDTYRGSIESLSQSNLNKDLHELFNTDITPKFKRSKQFCK